MSKKALVGICVAVFAVFVLAGCSSQRNNIVYKPDLRGVKKLETPVTGMIVPVVDANEKTKAYPRQVIKQTSYGGDVTYDINDRTSEEVFTDAMATELSAMGVKLIRPVGIKGPLDKDNAQEMRKQIAAEYPDVQVAFGAKILDFLASSKNGMVTTRVNVAAGMQLTSMDVKTGDLIWSDYRTDWEDTKVTSASHNYMIEQLDNALASLMVKGIRNNNSLREFLVKISGR